MATYAVGDIQGCIDPLLHLVAHVGFDPGAGDRLWLVGDVVNRGPRSLEVLRWVHENQDHVRMVLGNHDLHLLAVSGGCRATKSRDTFREVLDAPDAGELLEWLRHQPLVIQEGEHLMAHAGLFPLWPAALAVEMAREAEQVLRGSGWKESLATTYGGGPLIWTNTLSAAERFRFSIRALTQMRTCSPDATQLRRGFKGPPTEAPKDHVPWYEVLPAQRREGRVIFGHWSRLGLLIAPGLLGLDTGCVYGRWLTAVRLEDGAVFQVPGQPQGERQPQRP